MNSLNDFITQRTIERLAPSGGESIVEISPGNSMLSLPIIEAIGVQGRYLGIDQSADIARLAQTNLQNQACADVNVVCCDVSKAGVEEGSIDGLLAVNIFYK